MGVDEETEREIWDILDSMEAQQRIYNVDSGPMLWCWEKTVYTPASVCRMERLLCPGWVGNGGTCVPE